MVDAPIVSILEMCDLAGSIDALLAEESNGVNDQNSDSKCGHFPLDAGFNLFGSLFTMKL